MTILTTTTTTTSDFDAAFDAGEIIWGADDTPTTPYLPTAAELADWATYQAEADDASEQAAYDAQALAAELAAEMFRLGGKALRKIAYTPTGRIRTTPEALAAQAEITRRASK